MGIVGWIAKRQADALFQIFGNHMFQTIRFAMDLIPGIPQFLVQEGFQKAVVADDLQRNLLSFDCQRNAVVLLIIDKGGSKTASLWIIPVAEAGATPISSAISFVDARF